jgi:hypothetical protein
MSNQSDDPVRPLPPQTDFGCLYCRSYGVITPNKTEAAIAMQFLALSGLMVGSQ